MMNEPLSSDQPQKKAILGLCIPAAFADGAQDEGARAFASTDAVGQVARKYYASGHSLSAAHLKEAFSAMLPNVPAMPGHYSGDILQPSRHMNVSELSPLAAQL